MPTGGTLRKARQYALVDKKADAALPGSINTAFYEVSTLFVVQTIVVAG
jgi:hypothetical protein